MNHLLPLWWSNFSFMFLNRQSVCKFDKMQRNFLFNFYAYSNLYSVDVVSTPLYIQSYNVVDEISRGLTSRVYVFRVDADHEMSES